MGARQTTTLVLAACLILSFGAETSWALGACETTRYSRAVKLKPRKGRPPLIIGDSTMLLATPYLGKRGLEADARGCRQFNQGLGMLSARKRRHSLPRIVILALGANGPIPKGGIGRALKIVGRDRILGLVTPTKSAGGAEVMRTAARRNRGRILLVDWKAFSNGRGWFAGDGLHVSYTGAREFAALVRRRVAPLIAPPVSALGLPRSAEDVKACAVVTRIGRRAKVFITRGTRRVTCRRARQLARRPVLRRVPGWRTYDWRSTGVGPWSDVYVRRDRKVIIATIARR